MQGNAKFAVAVDGSNEKLQQRKQTIDALRREVRPPFSIRFVFLDHYYNPTFDVQQAYRGLVKHRCSSCRSFWACKVDLKCELLLSNYERRMRPLCQVT